MVIDELEKYLTDVGVPFEIVQDPNGQPYLVMKGIEIAGGTLAGRACDVAVLRSTENPWVPQAALQVRPALVPMGQYNTQASPLGTEWQYWSRRFDRPPTPKSYLAHVYTVLAEV